MNTVSLALSGLVLFSAGLYGGSKLPALLRYIGAVTHPAIETDRFGRLLGYPGKVAIDCPAQGAATAVLLVIGQSNAANYQGQRYQADDDRVVNYSRGHCYRAATPLLGADGRMGES